MLRVVEVENGLVEGIEAADPRITAFKGIPFAAPPIGENRWRAPQPCEDWEGTLMAHRFAPISVQDTPGVGTDIYCREWHVDKDIPMDEDCLYLNVWTNAKSADEKLPVVVWFFGGALQWGYPAEMEFDGERIARRGVVVVTVNYRINVFGFLAHPDITKESPDAPTNFGNLDQQAGLKWVKRNIAAFGGDPDNITIAGQSAGGGSVMSQLACPSNEGLFNKAIVQSAMIYDPYTKFCISTAPALKDAEKLGEEFFEFIGVKTLEEARKLDAFYIRDKYGEFAVDHPRMMIVQDDKFCFGDPIVLYGQNKCIKVPMLSGNTTDEFPSIIKADSDEEYIAKAKEIFGDKADEFMKLVEKYNKINRPYYANLNGIECTTKAMFLKNAELGNKDDCYYYSFDADIPGEDNPGTFHSVELWFFFETLAKCSRPYVGRHYDLARLMCNYWCNFVKTGNPNGKDADGTMMPEWLPYTKENPYSMVFDSKGAKQEKTEEKEYEKFFIEHIKETFLNQ